MRARALHFDLMVPILLATADRADPIPELTSQPFCMLRGAVILLLDGAPRSPRRASVQVSRGDMAAGQIAGAAALSANLIAWGCKRRTKIPQGFEAYADCGQLKLVALQRTGHRAALAKALGKIAIAFLPSIPAQNARAAKS